MSKINIQLAQSHVGDAQKTTPVKKGKSAFDDALQSATPVKATPVVAKTKPAQQGSDDATRSARMLAALSGVPLTQLVAPSRGFQPVAVDSVMTTTQCVAIDPANDTPHVALATVLPAPRFDARMALPSVSSEQEAAQDKPAIDAEPTQPVVEAAASEPTEELTKPEIPSRMPSAPAPAATTATPAPANVTKDAPVVDTVQVAQIIADVQPTKSDDHAPSHDRDAQPQVVGIDATRAHVETAQAVTPVAATQESRWQGLAEKIADLANDASGSIEGARARVVLGQGDDRVVLTVSTHASRVAIEVDASTRAGSQLADALRGGSDELRTALGRHGLELDTGGQSQTRSQPQAQDVDETQPTRRVAKPTTSTELRPVGVVLA